MKSFNISQFNIKYHNIYILLMIPFISFIMFIVEDTNSDRYAYIEHFSNPFFNSRIEPLFQYYMYIFYILNIPANIGTIITILIIYGLFVKIWFNNANKKGIESFLVINFLIFSVFNYYLGTSIRMGLAVVLALYYFYKIQNTIKLNIGYYILLISTIFIHYGVSLFIVLFLCIKLFFNNIFLKNYFHLMIIFAILLICGVKYFIIFFDINGYYSMYLDGYGTTERLIPFTILVYIICIFILLLVRIKDFNIILVIYGTPFILLQFIMNFAFIGKMLIPLIFIAMLEIYNVFYSKIQIYTNKYFRIIIILLLNILSVLYALKMYNYY